MTTYPRRLWTEVSALCGGAAVFLDSGAAEVLHWAGGVRLLGDCVGVYDLYQDLSPVARDYIAMAPYCHVVLVVTSFLTGRCSVRISRLLSDLQPLECHVFCSQPEIMHSQWVPMPGGEEEEEEEGSFGTYSHYGEFQALMRKWINRESGVRVSVTHLPLFHCEVCPGLLITPTHATLFPLLPSDVEKLTTKLIEEGSIEHSLQHLGQIDFDMLTHEFQTNIKGFVWGLNNLLLQLEVREDIFSLGHTSQFIASQLAALPEAKTRRKTTSLARRKLRATPTSGEQEKAKTRRKSTAQRASLLLVDRTLDLTGPASHPVDSLADRMLSLLPHLPQHTSDVCVDMSPISNTTTPGVILPGCLAQPQSAKAQQLLKTLIHSKQKESLMEVSRCLLEAVSQEGLSVKLTGRLGRPSAAQLQGFLQLFRGHPDACISQQAVLQLACAVVETLTGDRSRHWEEMASIEKLLMLSVNDTESPSVLKQLMDIVKTQLGGGGGSVVTLCDLLGVMVGLYSLVGEDCADERSEEREAKEALAELILKHRDCDAEFSAALGIAESDSRDRVLDRLTAVFQRLIGLGETRDQLKHLRHTFDSEKPSPLLPYHSLLAQVVDAIFSPSKPDLPDLEYHSHGLADILKSSISLFMSSARPRPSHHPLLILFVVGGVTCAEVRQIQDIAASHKTNVRVVVGTTKLLTPEDITTEVLCRDHLGT